VATICKPIELTIAVATKIVLRDQIHIEIEKVQIKAIFTINSWNMNKSGNITTTESEPIEQQRETSKQILGDEPEPSHFVVNHTHKHIFNKPIVTGGKDDDGGLRTRMYHHQGRRQHLEKQTPEGVW
jgi:hypothetical protein